MNTPEAPFPANCIDTLRRTQPWLRFIGIMMMIGAGLIVLAAVAMILFGLLATSQHLEDGDDKRGIFMVFAGLLYLPLALLYLYPAILLLRSARRIRDADETGVAEAVAGALEAQRKFWKYVGICLIALLALYALAIVAAVLLPALKHLG